MVAAMDKVGVDGAIFISAFSMYRYDASYAVDVHRAHPGRLAIGHPVDPDAPGARDLIPAGQPTAGSVRVRTLVAHAADPATRAHGLPRLSLAGR